MKIIDKFYTRDDKALGFKQETIPDEWWLERFRNWRSLELLATDWTQLPDANVEVDSWATYRQTLRDIPANDLFPDVDIPDRPQL